MCNKKIKFALFADLHYKEGMYLASVLDMDKILQKASKNNVDFIIHAGDFCNDYKGSPEVVNRYLNNVYNLPAYGIYGNHELETEGNNMQNVTPLLNNRPVVWGAPNGKNVDGSIGYFYFDVNGFRIICTDTNYSFNQDKGEWQHNLPASWGPPDGNVKKDALAPQQLKWLKKVLNDSADAKIPCIVMSHQSFSGVWADSPDGEVVRQLFKDVNIRQKGTVLMAINGHLHSNHLQVIDDVLYLDVNTVKNGCWIPSDKNHYGDLSYDIINYDDYGNAIGKTTTLLNDLSQGTNTWFFDEPLSAIVTVSSAGEIVVEGMDTTWLYDVVAPNDKIYGYGTKISSGKFIIPKK